MSDYQQPKKAGKLQLKNVTQNSIVKANKKKKKTKKSKDSDYITLISKEAIMESKQHGGWWIVDSYDTIPIGNVAFQHDSGRYITALDTGTLVLSGDLPEEGCGPSTQQIFTLFKVTESKYALKTFTGKFIGVNARGEIYASGDAISQREQLEIAIEHGKVALQASTTYFISYNRNCFSASASTAKSPSEIFTMRTNNSFKIKKTTNIDDQLDPKSCEVNYVKQFQSFGYKKVLINSEDVNNLVSAKGDGRFHEEMLDRREKMKSDRYCK